MRAGWQCEAGVWSPPLPACLASGPGPTQPPPILWSAGVRGRAGQLILSPGSILHLDCLADRRRGSPSWSWSRSYREYPTGLQRFIHNYVNPYCFRPGK